MKALKIYSVVITIIAVILLCAVAYLLGSSNSSTQNTSSGISYAYTNTLADNTDSSNSDNFDSTANSTLPTSNTTTTSTTESTTSEYIGTDRAKEIALEHAGLSDSDVTWGKTELDVDLMSAEYELEFYYNNQEYDYEINAKTGEIVAYEVDNH